MWSLTATVTSYHRHLSVIGNEYAVISSLLPHVLPIGCHLSIIGNEYAVIISLLPAVSSLFLLFFCFYVTCQSLVMNVQRLLVASQLFCLLAVIGRHLSVIGNEYAVLLSLLPWPADHMSDALTTTPHCTRRLQKRL